MQNRQDDLDRRPLLFRVHVDRNATTVVHDPHAATFEQRDLDGVAETRQGLVDGVVHDLPHQMVQAALAGRTDIHAGALADRLEPFEHGDR